MQDTVQPVQKLKQTIEQISNLPTPPMVFQQINKVINDPKTSAYDIAAIISEDPAMSVKILKLSNSAFYGSRQEVTSVKQAIVIMGLEAVKSMVLSSAVFDMFKGSVKDPQFQEDFWRHSLATAFGSRLIVRKLWSNKIIESEVAFSIGLLHDIGLLVQYAYLPDDFAKVREVARESVISRHKAEEQVLGYTHADVGALLARKWNLPHQLQDAVENHHYPQLSQAETNDAYIVHFADYLAHVAFDSSEDDTRNESILNESIFEVLDITKEQVDTFKSKLVGEYAKAETFMQMAMAC